MYEDSRRPRDGTDEWSTTPAAAGSEGGTSGAEKLVACRIEARR